MAADKEDVGLSRVDMYEYTCVTFFVGDIVQVSTLELLSFLKVLISTTCAQPFR